MAACVNASAENKNCMNGTHWRGHARFVAKRRLCNDFKLHVQHDHPMHIVKAAEWAAPIHCGNYTRHHILSKSSTKVWYLRQYDHRLFRHTKCLNNLWYDKDMYQ